MKRKHIKNPYLIESDDEGYYADNDIESEQAHDNNKNNTENTDENKETEDSEKNENEEDTLYLIYNKDVDSDDPKISDFLKFCMKEGLFDNTFYDMHNSFSVVATKLPRTFEKLSKNGNDVKKRTFISKFKKEFGYAGDINFIYNCLDEKHKGFVTWDEFLDFFLPYIQYITV